MAPKRTIRSTPVTTTPTPTATTTTSITNAQLQAIIDQGVIAALAARDANRNGDDSHTSGTGGRRTERVVRECTYQDFMKCKPLYFKRTEGVVELIPWFKRMETVFRISNCSVENQIKFSTCTLLVGALTWWNSYVLIVSHDVAYAMTWADLRKKMADKGHFKKECPKAKNKQKPLKQAVNDNGIQPNCIGGTCRRQTRFQYRDGDDPSHQRYASILIDTGAERSFVSTAFSSQMDITNPSTLDHYYDVELADGRIISSKGECLLKSLPNVSYHQLRVREEDIPKTAFRTLIGHSIISSDTFGFTNAPANKREHEEHLKLILELLKKEELYAKFSKCEFWIPKVTISKVRDDSKGFSCGSCKIKPLKMASPRSPTEISNEDFIAYCYASKKGKVAVIKAEEKSDYICGIRNHPFTPKKQTLLADATISMKDRDQPLDSRLQSSTIGLDHPIQLFECSD
ncbi:hypothetical protein Tco_1222038 [Tanacetum coccineum]